MHSVSAKKDHVANSRFGANTFGGGFPVSQLSTEKKLGKRRFPNEALSSGYGVGTVLSPSSVDSNNSRESSHGYQGRQQPKRDSPHSLSSTGSSTLSKEETSKIPTLAAAAGKPTVREALFENVSSPSVRSTKLRPKRSPLAEAVSSKKLAAASSSQSASPSPSFPPMNATAITSASAPSTTSFDAVMTVGVGTPKEVTASTSSASSSKSSESNPVAVDISRGAKMPPKEEQQVVTVDGKNLQSIVQKLDEALMSIKRNELKMKELEQDNVMLREVNAKKLAELEHDNQFLKENIQRTNQTLQNDVKRIRELKRQGNKGVEQSRKEQLHPVGDYYSSYQYHLHKHTEECDSKQQDPLTPNRMKLYLSFSNNMNQEISSHKSSKDKDDMRVSGSVDDQNESIHGSKNTSNSLANSRQGSPTWDAIYSPESPTIRTQLSPMHTRRQTVAVSPPYSRDKKLNLFYGSSSLVTTDEIKTTVTDLNDKYNHNYINYDLKKKHGDGKSEKNFNLQSFAFQFEDAITHHISLLVILGYFLALLCVLLFYDVFEVYRR